MHRIIAATLILILSVVGISLAVEVADVKPANPGIQGFVGYAPDRIVVKFDASTFRMIDKGAFARGKTGWPDLDQVGMRHGVASIKPQFPGAEEKEYKGKKVDLSGWHKINFAGKADIQTAVTDYKKLPGVVDAQPVSIHTVYREPNDLYYPFNTNGYYQWHLPKIHAPEAWEIETGDPGIIVAVPDTGVAYFAKDLGGANASYKDPGEINPNDISGNVWTKLGAADWIGWDFVQSTNADIYECTQGEDCSDADNDPRDFNGHGTHCAGNVGAMSNNGYDVASVAGGWGTGNLQVSGNGVRVMPLRIGWSACILGICDDLFFPELGLVAMDYAAQALQYAADNGARIATCSWGSENTGGISDAIAYFLGTSPNSPNLQSGGLIFKAAGNDGTETADYICSRGDVICVAATDQNDCKADFSTYGSWVDISAPGVSILSLYYMHGDPANDNVAQLNGTSMATPMAAAVAALIWSKHPDWKADQVKQQLYASADPIDNLSCNTSYAGKMGAGRINAYKAVSSSPPAPQPPTPPTNLSATPDSSSQISLSWTDNANNESGFKIQRCQDSSCSIYSEIDVGQNAQTYQDTNLAAATTYFYRVRAYNSDGFSGYSNTASATTQAALTVPAAPSTLTATAVSRSQINLAWNDNSTNETGFEIQRCTGNKCSGFIRLNTVGANVFSYQDTNLLPRTSYRYRVRAYNAAGSSAFSNVAGAKTPR